MNEILQALGYSPTRFHRFLLTSLFLAVIGSILFVSACIHGTSFSRAVVVHTSGWVLWFCWLGRILPNSQRHCGRAPNNSTYRTAFWRHILPGISFGVAQMLRPALFGFLTPRVAFAPDWRFAIGLILGVATLFQLVVAFRGLGFAAAGFLYEYQPASHGLVRKGIYSWMRHPLFFGSVLGAFALTLFFDDLSSLYLALLNIAALPVYRWLEDKRLVWVFGNAYKGYRSTVPGYLILASGLAVLFRRSRNLHLDSTCLQKTQETS